MKLIVGGATGFVGTETTLRALAHPSITSVVALTRRPLELPNEANASKLTNIILDDFSHYPDSAKEQLADADACIWYVLPLHSPAFPLALPSSLVPWTEFPHQDHQHNAPQSQGCGLRYRPAHML